MGRVELNEKTSQHMKIIEAGLAKLPPEMLATLLAGYAVTCEVAMRMDESMPKSIKEYHKVAKEALLLS